MKVLLLGLGAQGKATLYDLLQNDSITEVVVVERDVEQAKEFVRLLDADKVRLLVVDANDNVIDGPTDWSYFTCE